MPGLPWSIAPRPGEDAKNCPARYAVAAGDGVYRDAATAAEGDDAAVPLLARDLAGAAGLVVTTATERAAKTGRMEVAAGVEVPGVLGEGIAAGAGAWARLGRRGDGGLQLRFVGPRPAI